MITLSSTLLPRCCLLGCGLGGLLIASASADEWAPKQAALMTRWAAEVRPETVHAEHPRPQMVRDAWQNLNGLWDCAVRAGDQPQPEQFDQQILVPFAIESALSGVMQRVAPDQALWYRRSFQVPAQWSGQRILLHFGAVDWETKVWVNGREVGEHRGGYDPFTFEITAALREGQNEVVLRVWDPTDQGEQPRGKQVLRPRGIWYTPVTGIWQTVWLEAVPATHVRSLKILPDVDQSRLRILVAGSDEADVRIVASDHGRTAGTAEGRTGRWLSLPIANPRLWSPDSPHLYDLEIQLLHAGLVVDTVRSYAGLRSIEVRRGQDGINRMYLNGQPLFQYGPLDQGWWPDGLYTAASDAALKYDVQVTKQLGFNMTRKHVKVEPARWYYWCDKLGLLVWQDMPSGGPNPEWIRRSDVDGPEVVRTAASAQQYDRELEEMIADFFNHPSIVVWVPFNERWGQFETERVTGLIRQLDPSRLVNAASGGNFLNVGDVLDLHSYPNPVMPPLHDYMAAVCGEFGGLGLPIEGHTLLDKGNWGYRSYDSRQALAEAYLEKLAMLRPMIGQGLAAAVYTQITDVEIEVNGLLTYDRGVIKIEPKVVAEANRRLYLPPPLTRIVAPTSQRQPQAWRYTTEQPAEGWPQPGFDAASWQSAAGGFGTRETPGAVIGTTWDSSHIWLRRTFELDAAPRGELYLLVHHDDAAEVYLNGTRVAELERWTTDYVLRPLKAEVRELLQPGRNVLAIHCHQDAGGQFIDAGLLELVQP